MVTRGEVWLVTLDPTIGHETKKTRPAVIISPDELNQSLATVIVAPMTTSSLNRPYRVPVVFGGKKGLVLIEQIRAVDKDRLVKRVGRVPGKTLVESLRTLQEMFAE